MSTQTRPAKRGIQSIEVGGRLLEALVERGTPMMLRDLAAAGGMPPAKAHRYLVSFIRMGLAEQDAETGHYDLGAFAVRLGLAGLARMDPVRLGTPVLAHLRDEIEETCALAVWGNYGATVVRWEEPARAVTVNLRTGGVLPLLTSATGLCFAAFLPAAQTERLLRVELAEQRRNPHAIGPRTYEQAQALFLAHPQSRFVANRGHADTGSSGVERPGVRSRRPHGAGSHSPRPCRRVRHEMDRPCGRGVAPCGSEPFPKDWALLGAGVAHAGLDQNLTIC